MRRRLARLIESGSFGWSIAALVLSVIALGPIIAIAVIAFQPSGDTWPHLIAHVLPGAVQRTLGLLLGVGILTLLIGTGTAWLVTMYRFPGRRYFQWLLLLPLAMPTYIIAFCYLELFDYSGVVQTALRDLFGWRNAQDYWFPDIRSLGGAIFFMSVVLYPYVYITARASFLAQSICVIEVSRTLGRSAAETFWQIALPLARPALAAGVALALMETLNDIGAVEFFGVDTLTVAVYSTWLDRGSLAGATQIACVMLAFVFVLLRCRARAPSGAPLSSHDGQIPGPAGRDAHGRKGRSGHACLRIAASDRLRAARGGPCEQLRGTYLVRARPGLLAKRHQQSEPVAGGRRACRVLCSGPRLWAPADAVQARPRGEPGSGH